MEIMQNIQYGLALWCLMPLCNGQFYWWRTPEYPEKTTSNLVNLLNLNTCTIKPVLNEFKPV